MIAILGAGIAGISAAYHLALKDYKSIVFEKRSSWGGLCDNFEIDGFRFDTFIHLSFTKSDYVKSLFEQSSSHISHKPVPYNFYKGYWLKHPAQNNIYPLPTDEKVKIIKGFINRKTIDQNICPEDYDQWLRLTYGDYYHENFSKIYTKKYWTLHPKEMGIDWIKNRIHKPSIDEVLLGSYENSTLNYYYAEEMRYPIKGGYKAFLGGMASKIDIRLGKKIVLIDLKRKEVIFSDGASEFYDHLISSLPLPELISLIKDVPHNVYEASKKLNYTSGQLVSLGFSSVNIPDHLWYYIYDEDIYPARVYSPSKKSKDNVPEGCSSLQFETYYSKKSPKKLSNDNLIDHIINKGETLGWFEKNNIAVCNYKEVKYANVIFDLERLKNLVIVKEYLGTKSIELIGRFGEWEYFWSDQSLLSGKNISEKLISILTP